MKFSFIPYKSNGARSMFTVFSVINADLEKLNKSDYESLSDDAVSYFLKGNKVNVSAKSLEKSFRIRNLEDNIPKTDICYLKDIYIYTYKYNGVEIKCEITVTDYLPLGIKTITDMSVSVSGVSITHKNIISHLNSIYKLHIDTPSFHKYLDHITDPLVRTTVN